MQKICEKFEENFSAKNYARKLGIIFCKKLSACVPQLLFRTKTPQYACAVHSGIGSGGNICFAVADKQTLFGLCAHFVQQIKDSGRIGFELESRSLSEHGIKIEA